jgi:V/A-type H+-transporting ATPase subunit K
LFFPALFLIFSIFFCINLAKKSKKLRGIILGQIVSFAAVILVSVCFPIVVHAAQTAGSSTISEVSTTISIGEGLKAIGASIAGGLASIGAGLAIAAAAPAAIGATSEDPKNFVKSLVFVAMGESIALFGILFVFMLK